MAIAPFTVDVPDGVLTDLGERLARTRWPDAVDGAGWDYGTDVDYLRELVAYWGSGYDWRAAEAAINAHEHVLVDVEGLSVHAVRQRASRSGARAIVLLHGWPDSFHRFHDLMPLLGDLDVVVPSLPGYGFSQRPSTRGFSSQRMADTVAGLMAELGHDRYVVHGGDVGSDVGQALAATRPDAVLGLHLTDVPYWHLFAVDPSVLGPAEQQYLDDGRAWAMAEGAYAAMQSTRPQTVAVGLNDSPAGLASWMVEKYRAWSDCGGDVESRFSKDELLTHITIYWATQTIGSSFRVYFEPSDPPAGRVEVPTAVAIFPHDLVPAPREFAERVFDLRRWTEMPRGGHFAALEEPELLAEDLLAFVAEVP